MAQKRQLYKLKAMENFRAGKRTNGGKGVIYKQFKENQVFSAFPDNAAGVPSNYLKVFKTPDGYMIPLISVQVLGPINSNPQSRSQMHDIQDAQIVEESDYYNKEQMRTAGTIFRNAAGGSKIIEFTKQRSKAAINTAMMGAGAGLIYAMATQKNKWLFITIGAVGGFILGNVYNNYVTNDNKIKTQKAR